MSKHEITGGWVVLRNPELVPERLRRPLFGSTVQGQKFADAEEVTAEALDFLSDFNDNLAIAMIESWSFGDAITKDALLDLAGRTYDDIRKLVAPFVSKLVPDFSLEGADDPKATTEQSEG